MIHFVRWRKWFFLLTGLLLVASVAVLAIPKHLPLGLEFSSGSTVEFQFTNPPKEATSEDVEHQLKAIGLESASVQRTGPNAFFVRTERVQDSLNLLLQQRFGDVKIASLDSSADLAAVVSFAKPVTEAQILAELPKDVKATTVTATGDTSYLVTGQGLAAADIERALKAYEQRYGAVERTTYDSADDMALTLDFGPPVVEPQLKEEIAKVAASGIEEAQAGENTFLVVGTGLAQEAKSALIPTLEKRFGRAKQTAYDQQGDMAVKVTFDKAVGLGDIRTELVTKNSPGIQVLPASGTAVVLVAKGLPADRQDAAIAALREKFGNLQRDNFDFSTGIAVTLDFGRSVTADTLGREAQRLESGVVVGPGPSGGFLLLGKNVPADRRDKLVSSLEETFGFAQRGALDLAANFAFQVNFPDPIQLADLLGALTILPIQDAVGGKAAVQATGRNEFLLFGTGLPKEQQDPVLSAIQDKVGGLDRTPFDKADDLAVTLDFGPTVNVADLRTEATKAEPKASVENIEGQKFFVGGSDLKGDNLAALASGLEQRFGRARQTPLKDQGTSLVLRFDKDTTLATVRDAVNSLDLSKAALASLGGNTFFLGGLDIGQDKQDALKTLLQNKLGAAPAIEPFDYSKGSASVLDFGENVDLAGLRAALKDLGFTQAWAEAAGTAFFVGSRGLSQEQQDKLVSGLETKFGLAKRAPINPAQDLALTIKLQDPARAAKAVTDGMVVQKTGPNRFLLAGLAVSDQRRQQAFGALAAAFGPIKQNPYDFSNGLASVLTFTQPISADAVKDLLTPFGYTNLVLEPRGENTYFLRSDRPASDQKNKIVRALEQLGPVDRKSLQFDSVDPEIARRSIRNTVWAVVASSVGITLYLWYAFRRLKRPLRYGVTAVIGLLHDLVLVLGILGLMAKFTKVEFNSLTIVGLLSVMGLSVNHAVVIFDRIRENMNRFQGRTYEQVVDLSLNETLTRNIATTVTVAVAILAVLIFGGATIRNLTIVLLSGVLAGAYNAQFLSANLLVSWDKGEFPRLRLRLPFLGRKPAPQPTS